MNLTTHRKRVLLLHLSFWCVYLSVFLYQVSSFQQRGRDEVDWARVFFIVGNQFFFAALLSYINYFLFLPRILAGKDTWKPVIQYLLIFAVIVSVRIFLERDMLPVSSNRQGYLYSTRFVVQVVTSTIFIVVFVGMLRFAEDWFELEARKKEVEHEKLMAELNFLKAQINPHFLFNTLNNLYYLAYTQSPNTTEVIDKLSKMMRYMIYESNHAKVLLRKEIEYMENYISLERLRLNNQIPIELKTKGNMEAVQIVPLIFITFLENAFKHGVSSTQPGCWVRISIEVKDGQCTYLVENSRLPGVSHEGKSGIGLQNVKRRLELSYPEKHQLQIRDLPDRYSVELTLALN